MGRADKPADELRKAHEQNKGAVDEMNIEMARQITELTSSTATLSEALDALDADPTLLAALGEPLARSYRAVKRAEIASVEGLSRDEQIAQLVEVY